MIIEIINESEFSFQRDGDWLKAGEFKSDKAALIPAKSQTNVEISPSAVEGVSGVAWWVDVNAGRSVYLSMALTKMPRLGKPTFLCFAGLPPANLKTQLSSAAKLESGDAFTPGTGCEWVGTDEGVRVRILPELDEFVPPTAADLCVKEKKRRTQKI
ncbi:unnamed protein product [Effrenium voratum]|nr:unnamed protein product [Effrenium voratum]